MAVLNALLSGNIDFRLKLVGYSIAKATEKISS